MLGFGSTTNTGRSFGLGTGGDDEKKYCTCTLNRMVIASVIWTGKPKAVKCFNGNPIHLNDDPYWLTLGRVNILSYCQETSLFYKGSDVKFITTEEKTYTDVCGDEQPMTVRTFNSMKSILCGSCDCKTVDKPKSACFYSDTKMCEVNAPSFDDTPLDNVLDFGPGRVFGDLLPPPKDCPKPRWAKMLEEAKPWQLDDEGFKTEVAHWIHADFQLDDDGKDAIDWGPYEYDGHPKCAAANRRKCCEPKTGFH